MNQIDVNFVCPKCGGRRLVAHYRQVVSKSVVDSFCLSSGGKGKYGILTTFAGMTEGKVDHYGCEACGYIVCSNPQSAIRRTPSPITNVRQLFAWLKTHNMLDQP